MAIRIMRMTRENYADAERRAREFEDSLSHLKTEWDRAKNVVDEELRRLQHDQNSLRGVLMVILDELEASDPKKPKG